MLKEKENVLTFEGEVSPDDMSLEDKVGYLEERVFALENYIEDLEKHKRRARLLMRGTI